MLRVLEVLATLRRAGAERVAVSLAQGLDRTRFDPAVVSLYDAFPGGFDPELDAAGIPVWRLGKRPGFDPRMWWRLAAVMRRFRPQVVHTHSYVLRYVWPAAWGRGIRLVHTVHNLAEREVDAIGRQIHRSVFRAGGVPVSISTEIGRSFERVYGFPPAATIWNGVDSRGGFLPEARGAWRRAHGFAPEDILVASVARLEPQKNPLGLIDAFHAGLGSQSNAHLVLAGEGSQRDVCVDRAARLGLSGRVHFLGLCQNVPEMLSACDIFALASDWEGAPVAVIEAMASRLPVAATAAGGVPDLVENGCTGMLVPPGDMTALGSALSALAADPERRRALGEAGARRAAQFDVRVMVSAYSALFEGLVR